MQRFVASCKMGNWFFLVVKRLVRPLGHPFPAALRWMGWSYTSASPLCFPRHVMAWPLPLQCIVSHSRIRCWHYLREIWSDTFNRMNSFLTAGNTIYVSSMIITRNKMSVISLNTFTFVCSSPDFYVCFLFLEMSNNVLICNNTRIWNI